MKILGGLSEHLGATLLRLAVHKTTVGIAGWHYGSLKALVKHGVAEAYRTQMGTEYRITVNREALAQFMIKHSIVTGHGDTAEDLRAALISELLWQTEAGAHANAPSGIIQPGR